MKQEYKTQIDASKISHCQKMAEQQKAIAAIIAEKKTQLKTAENTAMGYHEMLQEISKEVVASGSLLLPEFTAFFRYTDLYPCKADLNRTLELFTPIYTLKQQIITSKIPESYI